MLPLEEVFSGYSPISGIGGPNKQGSLRRDFRTDFEMALDMINNAQYTEALAIFQRLLKEDPDNYNLNFLIGYCYNQNNQKVKALPFLEKAVLSTIPDYSDNNYKERNSPVYAYFYLGQSFHWLGRLNDAETNYSKFRSFLVTKSGKLINQKNFEVLKDVDAKMNQIVIGKKLMSTPLDAQFIHIPFINSANYSVSGAQLSSQKHLMFFNRQKTTGQVPGKSDIFQVKRTNSVWGKVEAAPGTINSPYNDIFSCLSNDSKFFLFASDRKGGFNIYYALQEGNKWTEPYDNLSINTGYNETFASISKDGTSMYFVSDRPGGFGGKDIYRIVKRTDGSWSDPENLGFTINTALNEDSPWLSDDGKTFYFSSESHNTMGGFDVFKSEFKNQMWQEPVNIGYPVNSPSDELYYKPDVLSNLAFFTSNRKSEGDRMEVFCIKYRDENGFRQDVFSGITTSQDTTISDSANITIPDLKAEDQENRQLILPDKQTTVVQDTGKPTDPKTEPEKVINTIQKPTLNTDSIAGVREKKVADSLTAVRLKRARDLQKKLNDERLAATQKKQKDSLSKIEAIKEKMAFEAMIINKKRQDSISEARKIDSLISVVRTAAEKKQRDSLDRITKAKETAGQIRQDSLDRITKARQIAEQRQQDSLDRITNARQIAEKREQDSLDRITNARQTAEQIQKRKENELRIQQEEWRKDSLAEVSRQNLQIEQDRKEQEKKERDAIERQRKIIYAIEKAKKDSLARVSYSSQTNNSGKTTRLIEEYLINGALQACDNPSPERVGKYTVQVGAGKMKVNYFKILEDKRVCFGPDGLARFTVGTYSSLEEAERVAGDLRRSGFKDAWIPEIDAKRCPCDDNDLVVEVLGENASEGPIKYTVQLGAGKMKINYFRNVGQIRLCNGDDGLLRFIFGEFSTLEEAEKVRQKLIEIGYKDAWVPEIDANRCHDVILQ